MPATLTYSGSAATGASIVLGAKEMELLLKKLPDQPFTGRAMTFILRKAAKPLMQAMKRMAPVSTKKTSVSAHKHYSQGSFMSRLKFHRPGELKRSIGIVTGKNKKQPLMWVGPRYGKKAVGDNDAWYFHFLEFGTSKMSAQPFIRPAYDATKNMIQRIIEADFEKLLNEFVEKRGPKYF